MERREGERERERGRGEREREYNSMLNVLHSNLHTIPALKHDAKAKGVRETQSTKFISVSINATM